jgi:polyisoprenoid-binding protein YceI
MRPCVIAPAVPALALLLAAVPAPAAPPEPAAVELAIGPDAGPGTVVFTSRAPMESFEGTTADVTGRVVLNPTNLGDSLEIAVQVDMASLDTGIGLRNRHMRENHLHTDRFPRAAFTGARILEGAGADLRDGVPHDVVLEGAMMLHGVTRTVTAPVRLTWSDGEDGTRLRIESRFEVTLADYDIPRPAFLIMKLNDVQRLRVDLWAAPAAATSVTPAAPSP